MTDDRRLARDPIAIVGMSGLLPKARNYREYWQNIVDGVDCTEEVPTSRWSLDDYYDENPAAPDKTYSRRGAFLPDVDFDPLEFGLPPNQLEVTSTMQTLSLGVARDLLLDAGATGSGWYDPARTGVVLGTTGPVPLMHPLAARLSTPELKKAVRSVGLSADDADAVANRFVAAFAPWEENSFPGLLANVVAGRVANRLGLGGMNCTVDAACAASLAAIRTAIAELRDGRADMMITGGVDTENTIFIYMCFSKVGALSHRGRISPFGADADGTLLGEGISMLALRRLEDARRDGNRIYAVIRGLGSSSDGRSKSIYAPVAEGQRVALDRAYADADCSPADVELIEAHATGTAVGDKTELTALKGLLAEASSENRFVALGSVKSQIGHTKGAAGTASVMKLALALHQKVLPGTINVDAPNAQITSEAAPFYVNSRTRPWISDPKRPVRRAAASAMGFGGTNFHVVLEEADGVRPDLLHRTPRAHIWHAPDVAALVDAVRDTESGDGGDIPEDHARIGFVSVDDDTAAELRALAIEELERNSEAAQWDRPEGIYYRAAALPDRKVGALFAGQGSQYVDMGIEAALNNPAVGAAFDAANAAFGDSERRLGSVVFPPPAFDEDTRAEQENTLRRTEFAQPGIGALSVGQYSVLRECGFRADGYLGHSFGELTALWASGAVATEQFYELARARGAAMTVPDGADAGTMVAIGAGREDVETVIAGLEDVWLCNHNAPDQVVIGGGAAGVAAAVERCAERGWPTRELPVSGAFHTPYVGHAVDAFGAAVAAVPIGTPDATVYANTRGAAYGDDIEANRATLAAQLSNPVDFFDALSAMRADGCSVFVEFGPKQVLTSLVRRAFGDEVIAIATDSGPVGNGDLTLKRAAVRLAVLGFDLRGINRHAVPDADQAQRKPAMAVTISAPEYVPESRRQAYAAALSEDYQLSVTPRETGLLAPATAPAPDASVLPAPVEGSHDSNGNGSRRSTGDLASITPSGPPSSPSNLENHVSAEPQYRIPTPGALDSALVQHLHTHRRYLDGQLELARDLAGALRHNHVDELLVRAIEAVKDHGVAISDSHSRAGEVVAQLAELEGGSSTERPRRVPVYVEPTSPAPALDAVAAPALAAPAAAPTSDTTGGLTVSVAEPAARTEAAAPAAATTPTAATPTAGDAHSSEAVRQVLREVVADKTGYPVEMVDPTMDLEADLGVDSIKRVQVIGALQERFPELPVLGPEQLGTLRTLDQVVDALVDEDTDTTAPEARPEPTSVPAAAAETSSQSGSADALRQVLREVVADKTGYPVEMVDPTMDLEADLGVDSIKRVQVIGALQERFPELPVLGPERLGTLRTLDQIVGELAGGDVHPKAEAAAETPRHVVQLVELPAVDQVIDPYHPGGHAVLVGLDESAEKDCDAIEQCLLTRNWTVHRASGPGDVTGSAAVDLCVVVAGSATDWAQAQAVLTDAILVPGRVLRRMRTSTARTGFATVTRLDGHLGFRGAADPVTALLGGLGGLVKTLAAEQPSLFCRALDIDPEVTPERLAELLFDELCDAARDTPEVGIDATGARRTLVPGHHAAAATTEIIRAGTDFGPVLLSAADTLVVTGGARGVTATCVLELARTSSCRFVLLGRTELSEEPQWAAGVAEADLKPAAVRALAGAGATPREMDRACGQITAVREIRSTLAELGDRAEYLTVDVTDSEALRDALAPWRDAHPVSPSGTPRGRITGVVHGAGVLADSLIPAKTSESIAKVLGPKLAGLAATLAAAGDPHHLVLFTSVAGLFGNIGQADYAVANEALNRFAVSWAARNPEHRVTAMAWGAWDGGMVTPELRQHFRSRGVPLLAPTAGAAAFTAQFTSARRDEPVLLIGAATALNTASSAPTSLRARRDITELVDEPVIAAHRIGDHVVLPATFGLGALVNLAERAQPGLCVVGVRDFHVLKGMVFDHPIERMELELEPAESIDSRITLRATAFADEVARFQATLLLADGPEPPVRQSLLVGPGAGADHIYRDGVQFHAPALQGLRTIRSESDEVIVIECALPAASVARGGFAGRLHDPVQADLVLQCPPVLGHRLLGAACLPLGIGRVDYYRPLPSGEPFLVVTDNPRPSRMVALIDATALALDGTVLQRFSDVTVLTTPDLSEKFRISVRRWSA
ncbi:type I polyketide synthase [Nocardia africana]|uniref:Beta-ketoacyl-acyl-carrier-protein synthase I n=1 Tax=Nocardia africana TaxID=134964 RepID=A0A378WWC6_9NOCA|nr:type I polyketide synthase [Nocardia africana]MCC3313891.1 type I polyketide synthase [Nocardia africana]SUA44724.1 Beta-ketoacyl-acyl-carrier-protein synthase I [Nocardia africana]